MARTRLQDVAERAGVSIKTVSNVVNGKGTITPATRQRVEEAVAALGYRPNVAAQHLRRGNSGIIAVALPEIAQPYFAELASELIGAARRRQLTVLLTETGGTAATERAVADGVDLPLMDGLILSPLAVDAAELLDRADSTPIVLLGEHVGEHPPFPHVAIDNTAAAADATAHLLALGRRRVAALGAKRTATGPNAVPAETAALRLAGYRAALDAAGVAFDPALVAEVADFHRADGAAAMHALLDLADPPDAVFCFNDLLALGALRALRDRGLTAPDDVAVIGIDDIEEGRFNAPSLSTVAPDKRSLAEVAIDLLLGTHPDVQPGGGAGTTTTVIAHRLIARESTGVAASPVPVPVPVTTAEPVPVKEPA